MFLAAERSTAIISRKAPVQSPPFVTLVPGALLGRLLDRLGRRRRRRRRRLQTQQAFQSEAARVFGESGAVQGPHHPRPIGGLLCKAIDMFSKHK